MGIHPRLSLRILLIILVLQLFRTSLASQSPLTQNDTIVSYLTDQIEAQFQYQPMIATTYLPPGWTEENFKDHYRNNLDKLADEVCYVPDTFIT